MAEYPGSEHETRVGEQALLRLTSQIFSGCGMQPEDAALVADSLVAADLRAVHSHGVLRTPEYVAKLLDRGVNPKGRPRVVKDSGAALVIDAGNSMGQVGSAFAMRKTMERARDLGVALAAVRGSNHCGAMFYYATMALDEDMIGVCATNALPTMAPWGGLDKIIGINPLAAALPAGEEHPVVLDAAFSYSSHGKIRVYHQKGLPIPPTWAFDTDGRPTTDTGRALEGLLQPIGEYKGVGLAVVMGLLATLLSGAGYGTETGNMIDGPKAGADGHFFLAIRVGAFEDAARFKARVDQAVRQIESGRRAEGAGRLYAPGGLEAEMASRYRADGIPLNGATLDGLKQASLRAGVTFEL